MYSLVLLTHSWLRWLVLILFVVFFIRTLVGWLQNTPFSSLDNTLRIATTVALDSQILIGFLLYFVYSPMVVAAFGAGAGMMKDPVLRFYAIEHITAMVLVVIIFHVGNVLAKKVEEARPKFKRLAISTGTALLIMAISIPWPFFDYGRVLFRLS